MDNLNTQHPLLFIYQKDKEQSMILKLNLHQVAFTVYRDNGIKVAPWLYAGYNGGSNYSFFTAPVSGRYYLFAACKGGEDKRCAGGGTLKRW